VVKMASRTKRRAARSSTNMRKVNQKAHPKSNEKIRRKRAPQPTETSRRKCANTEKYRSCMTPDDWDRKYAIDTASERFRKLIKLKRKPRTKTFGRPPKIAYRPKNYADLLSLIPQEHRMKPTAAGQQVIYVPHESTPCEAWVHAKVLSIHRHKDSNWIVVHKPIRCESVNPYLAIDSSNVFLQPPKCVKTATFSNVGVYVLHCEALGKWYVGQSTNIANRIARHRDHTGAKATREWPSFERIAPLTTQEKGEDWRDWERRECEVLKREWGYKNVRGGPFSQTK